MTKGGSAYAENEVGMRGKAGAPMLKIAGAALVLTAAVLYGWQLRMRLSGHLEQLLAMKELLQMLAGEIAYAKTPLPEAFMSIAKRQERPYGEILRRIARQMEQPGAECLAGIWQSAWEENQDGLLLQGPELQIICGIGRNLGYLDIETQLGHLAMHRQQLEGRIALASGQLAAKQKLCQCLSVVGGLFLILILI